MTKFPAQKKIYPTPPMQCQLLAQSNSNKTNIHFLLCNLYISTLSVSNQLPTRPLNNIRRLLDLLLPKIPIPSLDRIADSREERLIVAGPELRPEDDVLELRAVGYLPLINTNFK